MNDAGLVTLGALVAFAIVVMAGLLFAVAGLLDSITAAIGSVS